MPVSRYSRHFGGKKGAAEKALASMIAQHGEKEGRRIFHATVAKRRGERERGTGLRKSMAERKKTRGRFKPGKKGSAGGLRGAMAARER